ncbi:NAD-dependent epimerase/dehydratase family protein [Arenimonas sp.]|nr:NAD-dependent epimerase/dehydratase family protein [Candidatus Parcubacteria bacterium]
MNKNILVIGGAGYIGSSCVNDLVNSGYEVVVLDNLSTGQMEKVHKNARITHGNILDLHFLEQVFIEDGFDTVIHLAAKKSVNESEENPELYFQNNVVGTLNILSMMSKYNVPKIIFSSTAAVYKPKNVENAIYTEDSEVEPINVYGRTKYMCELMIKDFQRLGKIKQYVIFRYFNVAGDTGLKFVEKNAQNVFPLLSNAIVNGTEFTIFGDDYLTEDGTGVRDYIHISDLANAHVLAVQADTSAVYNLGTKMDIQ